MVEFINIGCTTPAHFAGRLSVIVPVVQSGSIDQLKVECNRSGCSTPANFAGELRVIVPVVQFGFDSPQG